MPALESPSKQPSSMPLNRNLFQSAKSNDHLCNPVLKPSSQPPSHPNQYAHSLHVNPPVEYSEVRLAIKGDMMPSRMSGGKRKWVQLDWLLEKPQLPSLCLCTITINFFENNLHQPTTQSSLRFILPGNCPFLLGNAIFERQRKGFLTKNYPKHSEITGWLPGDLKFA